MLLLLFVVRSEEHTSELQSRQYLVCRLLLEKKYREHRALRQTFAQRDWAPRRIGWRTHSRPTLPVNGARLLIPLIQVVFVSIFFFLLKRRPANPALFPNRPPFQ